MRDRTGQLRYRSLPLAEHTTIDYTTKPTPIGECRSVIVICHFYSSVGKHPSGRVQAGSHEPTQIRQESRPSSTAFWAVDDCKKPKDTGGTPPFILPRQEDADLYRSGMNCRQPVGLTFS